MFVLLRIVGHVRTFSNFGSIASAFPSLVPASVSDAPLSSFTLSRYRNLSASLIIYAFFEHWLCPIYLAVGLHNFDFFIAYAMSDFAHYMFVSSCYFAMLSANKIISPAKLSSANLELPFWWPASSHCSWICFAVFFLFVFQWIPLCRLSPWWSQSLPERGYWYFFPGFAGVEGCW